MAAERSKADSDRSVRIGRWFAGQIHNIDPERRDAARHVLSRWDATSPWFSMGRVMRTLQREESAHLTGFLNLANDFAEQFEEDAIGDIGTVGPFTPYDIVRCMECKREAIPGSDRCGRHGGQFLTAKDAQKISQNTTAKIIDATDRAVRVLTDLMDHARSEKVRLDAANSILDRAGHGGTQRIELEMGGNGIDAAQLIHDRLTQIGESTDKVRQIEATRAQVGDEIEVVAEVEPDPEPEPEQ